MHTSVRSGARKEEQYRAHSTNILVVDDDPDFLDLLISEIGQIPGVTVDIARSPAEALRLLTLEDYHLIVSDWALDDTDASEILSTADHIIGEEPEPVPYSAKIPVMFISGSEKVSQTQVLHRLKHFEPVSFLLKRCGPSLIKTLAQHILARFAPVPEMKSC